MRSLQLLNTLASSHAALAPVAGVAGVAGASAVARSLRSSAVRLGFGSHMSDNDPTVLELEKRRSLSKGKLPGGGGVPDVAGWNEALASDSEAVVRLRARDAARPIIDAWRIASRPGLLRRRLGS